MRVGLEQVRAALAGRYVVERSVAQGAMAAVFQGRNAGGGADIAIKILRPEFAATLLGDRFHREIAFLARLDHPHILPLLDSGEAAGFVYYVMPFADGGSLRDRLARERRLSLGETLAVGRDVAAGLDYAHERNIVHRDIKPENVMFASGRARIADFGVARAIVVAAGEAISSSGLVVGTPAYMSPEQASGEPGLDARTDVYALACMLYEMLVGEPPFTGRTAQAIMARQVAESPPSVRVVRPDLPEQVAQAIHAALAKEPGRRPGTAGTLVERLAP